MSIVAFFQLLCESEKIAQQAGYEFDQLKAELYQEREKSSSLEEALNNASSKLNLCKMCKNCDFLMSEVDRLNEEKQKAVATAKFAIQKLYRSAEQHRSMLLTLQRKERDVQYLRREIYRSNARVIQR